MSDLDLIGQVQIERLLRNRDNDLFNAWEKSFIDALETSSYSKMTAHEKAIVNRLVSWMDGKH